jgi:hypothetical protein
MICMGIDLHARHLSVAALDQDSSVVLEQRLDWQPPAVGRAARRRLSPICCHHEQALLTYSANMEMATIQVGDPGCQETEL